MKIVSCKNYALKEHGVTLTSYVWEWDVSLARGCVEWVMRFRFIEILNRRSFTFGGRVGLHVSRAVSGSTARRRWTFLLLN